MAIPTQIASVSTIFDELIAIMLDGEYGLLPDPLDELFFEVSNTGWDGD